MVHNNRRQLGVSERSEFAQMMDSTRLSDARAYIIRTLPCFSCDLSSEAKIYHNFCCVFSDCLQKSKSCGEYFCEISMKAVVANSSLAPSFCFLMFSFIVTQAVIMMTLMAAASV